MTQSIYIPEIKIMDSHQPLLYIDMVVDRNTGTIELLPSKNLKPIGKNSKGIGSLLVRC